MSSEPDSRVGVETRADQVPAAQTDAGTECSRWAKRRPSHAIVTIQSRELSKPVSCTMRNSSSTGALLECAGGHQGEAFANLPDTFTIYLPMERISIECRLVWRQYRRIGVQYTAPARVLAKTTAPTRSLSPAKKNLLARATSKLKR